MQMNALIPMSGNQVDFAGSVDRGAQARAQVDQFQRQNALAALYQQQGPGIVAGDPAAENALARFDPLAVVNARATRQDMQAQQQRMEYLTADQARAIEKHAMEMDAAARQQTIAETESVMLQAIRYAETGDWGSVNGMLAQRGIAPVQNKEEFRAVLAPFKGALDIMKTVDEMNAGPGAKDRYRTVGNQLVDLYADGGPQSVLSGETPGQSFSVTTPDGTMVQMGPSRTPTGQDAAGTATPRDAGALSSALSKGDASVLSDVQTAARTAAELESLGKQLETIAPNVGYTGPAGELYGAVDDAIGILSGDSAARGAFRSLAMEAQLAFTEKTKGSITDLEMAMFREAVPNLSQTPEANAMIAQVMQAGAARVQTRAAFFENWARKNGSLEGAQEVWTEYMRDNPIIERAQSGELSIRPEGEWIGYLNRKPANSYTPEAIMQMDPAGLAQIPIERMTPDQLDAIERRFEMLQGGGQ